MCFAAENEAFPGLVAKTADDDEKSTASRRRAKSTSAPGSPTQSRPRMHRRGTIGAGDLPSVAATPKKLARRGSSGSTLLRKAVKAESMGSSVEVAIAPILVADTIRTKEVHRKASGGNVEICPLCYADYDKAEEREKAQCTNCFGHMCMGCCQWVSLCWSELEQSHFFPKVILESFNEEKERIICNPCIDEVKKQVVMARSGVSRGRGRGRGRGSPLPKEG